MNDDKNNHHVIPQFYLKRFANENRLLLEHKRPPRGNRLVPVSEATGVHRLYATDTAGGEEALTLENTFMKIEDRAARAFSEIIAKRTWPLHPKNRESLASWVAAQVLRTPRSRRLMDVETNALRRHVGTLTLENVRALIGPADLTDAELHSKWSETLDYYKPFGPQPRNAHAKWFAALFLDATKDLFYRDWYLVRYDTPSFLISDNPVIALLDDGRIANSANFLAANRVFVPLDRWTCVLLHRSNLNRGGSVRDRIAPQPPGFAEQLNRMAVADCDDAVFEHPSDALFPGWLDLASAPVSFSTQAM